VWELTWALALGLAWVLSRMMPMVGMGLDRVAAVLYVKEGAVLTEQAEDVPLEPPFSWSHQIHSRKQRIQTCHRLFDPIFLMTRTLGEATVVVACIAL